MAIAVVVVGGGTALVTQMSGTAPKLGSGPTVGGRIVFKYNGSIAKPDYVGIADNHGKLVGYEPGKYIPTGGVGPVYARNLHTLVGHEYPGIGFVPLGQTWWKEPCAGESTSELTSGSWVSSAIACPSTLETVPNVVGFVTPTAMGKLSSMSLSPLIKYIHSSTIASGHIVNVTPVPGTKVHARSDVTVVSSLGPNGPSDQSALPEPGTSKPS
jgi:hypothetical protein